jgi:hypothetical protein
MVFLSSGLGLSPSRLFFSWINPLRRFFSPWFLRSPITLQVPVGHPAPDEDRTVFQINGQRVVAHGIPAGLIADGHRLCARGFLSNGALHVCELSDPETGEPIWYDPWRRAVEAARYLYLPQILLLANLLVLGCFIYLTWDLFSDLTRVTRFVPRPVN